MMNVEQLISELLRVPMNAQVGYVWDGGVRSNVEKVWIARSGVVVLSDENEVCYYTNDRPESAPTEKEEEFWYS